MSDTGNLAASSAVTLISGGVGFSGWVTGNIDVITVVISAVGVLSGIIFGLITIYSIFQTGKKRDEISKNKETLKIQANRKNKLTTRK